MYITEWDGFQCFVCVFFHGSILFSLWIMNQHFPRAMCCFFCWFPLQVFLWFCPGNSVSPFAVNKTNCRGILTNSTFPWARESQVIAKETVQFCVSSSLEFFHVNWAHFAALNRTEQTLVTWGVWDFGCEQFSKFEWDHICTYIYRGFHKVPVS